jgi:hypothetical protein
MSILRKNMVFHEGYLAVRRETNIEWTIFGLDGTARFLSEFQRKYNMALQDLGIANKTDKATDHGYLPVYEMYFKRIREAVKNFLEIGVLHGNSLRMWRDYFPSAKIFGIDIKIDNFLEDDRISLHKGDSTDVRVAEHFEDNSFDIIVDDASHIPQNQIITLCWFWSKLKTGGFYFIEDIGGCSPDALTCVNNLSRTERANKILNWFAPFRPTIYKIYKNNRHDDILLAMQK